MRRRHSAPSYAELTPGEQPGPGIDDGEADLGADEVIVVPRRADPAPKAPFPVIGCLAPLGVAVVVWFVLHSPLALIFALLSPVMAVAGLVDGRMSARRAARRNDAEVQRRRRLVRERVRVVHAREIEALEQRAPSAHSILSRTVNPFTATVAAQPAISLGFGAVRSSIRVEGGSGDEEEDARRLRAEALHLRIAPVLASAPARIAVVGAWPLVHALARGYAVQLAAAISPDAVFFLSGSNLRNARGRSQVASATPLWDEACGAEESFVGREGVGVSGVDRGPVGAGDACSVGC